jgi:hypothetical protein
MSVALVMVIFYTYPVLVAGASSALGRERLTLDRLGALACAGFGLALVLGTQLGPETSASLVGVALAATAAVCHATYFVVARDGFPSVPAVQATSLVLAGGVVVSGAGALASRVSIVGVGHPHRWATADRRDGGGLPRSSSSAASDDRSAGPPWVLPAGCRRRACIGDLGQALTLARPWRCCDLVVVANPATRAPRSRQADRGQALAD